MTSFILRIKCFFSGVFRDIRTADHRNYLMLSREPFRLEERYVRAMARNIRQAIVDDRLIKNLLGDRRFIMVEIAIDEDYVTVSFFKTLPSRMVEEIKDVEERSKYHPVHQKNISITGIFRYIYDAGYLEYTHLHESRAFNSTQPCLVLQPRLWEEMELLGTFHFEPNPHLKYYSRW